MEQGITGHALNHVNQVIGLLDKEASLVASIDTAAPTQVSAINGQINTVEANCEKNLQAPGLVNALGHLVLNWQRHQAHEAAKAANVHGNAGVHGNGGVHGNSANHGPSNGGTSTGS